MHVAFDAGWKARDVVCTQSLCHEALLFMNNTSQGRLDAKLFDVRRVQMCPFEIARCLCGSYIEVACCLCG